MGFSTTRREKTREWSKAVAFPFGCVFPAIGRRALTLYYPTILLAALPNGGFTMKKLLIVGASLGALVAMPAMAADVGIPRKAAPPPPAPVVYNWTGFYIGANVGGARGNVDWRYVVGGGTGHHDTMGALAGGQIGFNWQTGPFVLGVEADWDWANINGRARCPNPAFDCHSTLDSLGTVRGRLGYATGPLLWYATGGFVWGDQRIETIQRFGLPVAPSGTNVNGSRNWATGWTAGVGLEFAVFPSIPNLTAKVEWLHYDLERERYTVDNGLQVDAFHRGELIRIGLNYRFNFGKAPVAVMASY